MSRTLEILAVKYMQKQIKSLSRHIGGICAAEDIECVHQGRVASRRLGNALQIFAECFAGKKVKLWRKELRRFRKRLGRARDRDVHIVYLQEFIQTLDKRSCRPGLARLVLRLEQERKKLQPKIIKSVNQFKNSKVIEDMYGEISRMKISLQQRESAANELQIYQKAQKHIGECLDDLLSYEDSLHHPEAIAQHHAMRISAKQLRYQMEVFLPAYDDALGSFLKIVKALQTYLGDIHDYDMWTDLLTKFETKEYQRTVEYFCSDRPFRRLRTGIRYFQDYCQQERERVFSELVKYWEQISEEGFSTALREVLQNGIEGCRVEEANPEKPPNSDIYPSED
jgi:CHAD domain-containing protein